MLILRTDAWFCTGTPPQWREPTLPLRVRPDGNIRFLDHTGAQVEKLGASRLRPMLQSIDYCTPGFDYKSLDLVCIRHNIRHLLRWITGTADNDFRIDLYLGSNKKTIIMLEYELECIEIRPEGSFRGYGDNFRKATTFVPPGQSHHSRIVNCVSGVLFE
jgi:hypothetical protein